MTRHFISFLGSHDLGNIEDGPVLSLLQYLKPTHIYLFITRGYSKSNKVEDLKLYYEKYLSSQIEIIETEIEDPTNHREIFNKISSDIEKINNEANALKSQVFINLNKRTPAIISVLSLLSMTGFINRCTGVYSPNPQFDNVVKTDTLDFYKNSFAYKTLATLINDKEYEATIKFLEQNKILKHLSSDIEFMNILRFTNQRIIGNFDKAREIYQKCELLHKLEYKTPANLYERASEYYISTQAAIKKEDTFQATLKLGIIREILTTFLCQLMLKTTYTEEILIYENKEEKSPRFNVENLEKYAPDLKAYIMNNHEFSKSITPFDFSREINAYTESIMLKYLLIKNKTKNLEKINDYFNKLQELKDERNKLAHRLSAPEFKPKWNKYIKEILTLISEEFSYPSPDYTSYEEINKILLDKLKQALN